MKNAIVLISLAILVGGFWSGNLCAEKAQSDLGVAIVTVGVVDEALTSRIQAFLSDELRCQVRRIESPKSLQGKPEDEAKELAKLLTPKDLAIVALMNIPEDVKFRDGVFASQKVGMLNVMALRLEKMDTPDSGEKYMRRVEKESLNVAAQVLGMMPCPFPRCALLPAANEKDLDAKARGLCPPCQGKLHQILKDKGVALKFEE